jgi:hypothetical protein
MRHRLRTLRHTSARRTWLIGSALVALSFPAGALAGHVVNSSDEGEQAAPAHDLTIEPTSCDGVFNPPPDDTATGEPRACGRFSAPVSPDEANSPEADRAICEFIRQQDPTADPLVCGGGDSR